MCYVALLFQIMTYSLSPSIDEVDAAKILAWKLNFFHAKIWDMLTASLFLVEVRIIQYLYNSPSPLDSSYQNMKKHFLLLNTLVQFNVGDSDESAIQFVLFPLHYCLLFPFRNVIIVIMIGNAFSMIVTKWNTHFLSLLINM